MIETATNLTQPKPPRLSSIGRAQERGLFDQRVEESRNAILHQKEMEEEQQRELEEEEIKRQRTTYAQEGGCCFKAREIAITYQ